MKQVVAMLAVLAAAVLAAGCTGQTRYHHKSPGDPAQYQAHFPDMDADGDDRVSRQEFKTYFPQSDADVFDALDMNRDGGVDHDEWHQFKEAHGMRDH